MLCDVMGLGKTIQTLGESVLYVVSLDHPVARALTFLANIIDGQSVELEDSAKTTLIVVPRSLVDYCMSLNNHV
jgi:SNF2 family DNA or RNA helicase